MMKQETKTTLAFLLSALLLLSLFPAAAFATEITLTAIQIETLPSKTDYIEGEEFRFDGLSLRLTFDDGAEEVVEYGQIPLYLYYLGGSISVGRLITLEKYPLRFTGRTVRHNSM